MNVKSSGTLERLQFHLAPDAEGTQGKSLGLENESNHFVSALAGGERCRSAVELRTRTSARADRP